MHTGLAAVCWRPDLAGCPFCSEGADKLQYELSLYLAIQQSVEHLRAAEVEAAEVAATAAADLGKPRVRTLRKAGAAPAPKAAAGTCSGTGPSAARQRGQAEPRQAQPNSTANSVPQAARRSKRALVTAEAAAFTDPGQAAAEDRGLVPGGGVAQGQVADAAAQAVGAAAEPAEAAAQVPAAGSRRRGRPRKVPATAVPAQPMALCQEPPGQSLLGKRAAEGGQPDSSPSVKQTHRDSPVVKAEEGSGPAGCPGGGAEGRTLFGAVATADGAGAPGGAEGRPPSSAVATAEAAGAAGLPAAEPAAGVQRSQVQKPKSPAVEPGADDAPAQPLTDAEGRAPPGAADAADLAGTRALLAADCATAGGGRRGAPVGGGVGPGDNLVAADVRQGGTGPAAEAAADSAATATLGSATAAGMPDAGLQGAVPAELWTASGCSPLSPTSGAVAATVKAEDVSTLGGTATAALQTAVFGGNNLGACSKGPCGGKSPLAAVPPVSDCPKATPKSRLAQTTRWRSLFGSRWTA